MLKIRVTQYQNMGWLELIKLDTHDNPTRNELADEIVKLSQKLIGNDAMFLCDTHTNSVVITRVNGPVKFTIAEE